MRLVGEHPEILAAAALARVDDERALDQSDAAEGAGDEPGLAPAQHEGPQVDVAGCRARMSVRQGETERSSTGWET